MFKVIPLHTLGVIGGKLPKDVYRSVMEEVEQIEKTGDAEEHNKKLAGIIEREYLLKESRSSLSPFLLNMAKEYNKLIPTDFDRITHIGDIWVNYQNKNEYNPLHMHDGQLSFVIWLKIPYKNSDERETISSKKSQSRPIAGSFQFTYTNILGQIMCYYLPVEEGWEGRIIMFPAQLGHQVYPFQTSDEYRISVSGNLYSNRHSGAMY